MRVRTTLVAVLLILGVVLSEVAPFLPPVAHASGTPLVSTSRSPTEADLVPAPARAASVHAQTLNLQLAGSPARETLRIKPYFGSTNARGGNSGSAVLHNVGGGATYKRAVARLRSSTTGSTVFNFDGTHPWFDTGLDLAAGQAVAITARGIIYIYNGCCPQSPAGDGTPAPPSDQYGSFPAPGLSKYSLIANIDGRAPFEIGPRRLFIAPRAGRLSLGINDEVTGDNGGNWTITVKTGTTGPGDHESGTPSGNLPACSQGDPVNCATGGFSHSFDDLSIPGHGLSLHFAHTYDALNSAQDGPLGYGWTDPYYMVLTTDASGSITVTEEGGTSVTFTSSGGLSYAPPSRVLATLVKNSDGTFTFLRRDQTHYTFTAPTASTPGKLIAEADRNGYVTTLAYVEDKLSSVTDSDGRALTFSYNGEHIASVRDPVGRTVAFTYNVAGELTDARDVIGGVTHFTYSLDGRHLLQSMTDPQGGTVTNAYNNLGRVTAQTDAMGRTTAFGYAVNDDGTQTTVITDARGTVTSELYASNVLLARTVGLSTPQQATWVYGYDPTTLSLALVMDPNGHVTTMTYDASGNLLSRADPLGRTTSYAYDALNDTTAITDPVGNVTDMTYDAHGNLLSTSRPLIAMSANNGTITMTSTRRSAVVAAACQGSAATSPCGAGVQGLAACAGRCTPTTGATGERGRPAGRDVVRTFSVPPGQSVLGLLDGPASRGARTPTPVPSRARSGSRKAGTTHSTPSCSTSRTRCATATPRRPVPPSAGSRRRDTVISIDDNAQGSGIDRFRYVGLWGHCKPCRDGARIGMYDRSSSFSRRAGDYYTLRFRGVGIALYSVHGPTHGIEEVILDGHSRTLIDLYNRRRQGDVLDHRYAHLADGIHVLTVHVTGRKNRKSGNVYVVADRIAITQAGIIPPRQTPTPPPATATRVVTRIPTSKPTTAPRSTSTPSPTVTRPIATAIVGSTTANPAPPAPTATATPMPTAAPTMVLPTATRAPAPTETPTATPALPTNTTTATPGATATATMIPTTSTPTATATAVPPSGTATGTPEADATQPASTVSAATGTPTLAAATTAPADTATATASPTTTSTQTSVPSPTVPPTATPTPLPSIPCADAGPYTATVCLTYDPAHPGDVIARTDPDGHTSYYTYDQYGDRTSASDPLGDTTTSTYDLIGRRTSVTRPLGNAAGVNPINYTTAMAYDAFGDTTAITDAQGNVTTYGYDQDQNLVTTTDALGRQTIDGYNLDNERTSVTRPDGVVLQTSYDDAGNVITTTDGLSQSTSFAYDALNRLISMTAPLGRTTVYTYDLAGNKTAMTDPLSQTTAYTYNEANEVVGVLRPDGKALTTGYDLDGRVASQMDGRGSTTSYGYDSLGRTVAVTDGLGRVTAYGYDLAGNRTALTDPMGRTTTSTYDAANRLASIAYSDGSTPAVQYSYDADGNRTAMGDGTGTTRYTYDTLNRATSIVDGSGQRMGYGYDGANEIITLTYPGGKQVARAYDTLGRVTSVTDWLGHTTAFGYDGNGNVVSEVYPNASSAVLSYNAASDLTGITDTVNGTARWTFGYDRNSLGQVSGVSDGIDGSAHTYGYDNTHRLTSDSGPGGTQGWAYDAADNLAAITTTVDARAFAYDQANELTVLIATTGAATVNVPYAYNADGDRTGQSNGEGGASAAFGWDQADRLVTATVGTTMTASYAYDGDGLRQSKTVTATDGTTITAETWDTADGLPQLVQNGSMRYVMGPLGPIEQIDGGNTPTYYYQDQLGSTRGLVDGSGSTVGTYSYDPYGNVTGHTGVSTPLQYAGQYTDAETGLQYLRARYYDPVTAQFLSRDPLVVVTGQAYIYTGDSPLNAIDPTGLYRCYPLGPDPCDMIVDGLHQSLQVFQGGVDQTEENVGQGVQGAIRDPKGTTIRVLHAVSGTSATVATGTGSLALTCSVAAAAGVETGPFDISAIGCAAVSGTVATVATGVGATSDVGLALLGNGSSKDLAIDAIGLGTLGLAKYIAHGLEGLDADARIKALADVVANAHAVPTFLIPFLHANEGGSGCATK